MKGDFLCVVLLLCENSARVRKICDLLDSNKEAFDYLFSHKAAIEAALGTQVSWQRSDDTKSSYVVIHLEGVSIENEADWTQMAKFHAEWSKKFYDVFVPYLREKYVK